MSRMFFFFTKYLHNVNEDTSELFGRVLRRRFRWNMNSHSHSSKQARNLILSPWDRAVTNAAPLDHVCGRRPPVPWPPDPVVVNISFIDTVLYMLYIYSIYDVGRDVQEQATWTVTRATRRLITVLQPFIRCNKDDFDQGPLEFTVWWSGCGGGGFL